MGAGEQILLCHSLESSPFTEFLDKVKQQHQQDPSQQLGYSDGQQPVLHHTVQKAARTSISATSHHLHESIKCVLDWVDANPTTGRHTDPTLAEKTLPPEASPYQSTVLSNRSTYPQLLQQGLDSSTHPERNHNLVNSLLSSTFREHSHTTLCRLRETLNNYYLENCIFSQEIATLPVTGRLNVPGVALTGTISTAATTAALATELGGLFGNDSIMDYSLNQTHAAGPPPLTYHWNFLFFVIIFIIAGGLGNILVCLAIALDRKLQNVTNYFLLSLAIADLLVSLFVMPLGAIPTFLGKPVICTFACHSTLTQHPNLIHNRALQKELTYNHDLWLPSVCANSHRPIYQLNYPVAWNRKPPKHHPATTGTPVSCNCPPALFFPHTIYAHHKAPALITFTPTTQRQQEVTGRSENIGATFTSPAMCWHARPAFGTCASLAWGVI